MSPVCWKNLSVFWDDEDAIERERPAYRDISVPGRPTEDAAFDSLYYEAVAFSELYMPAGVIAAMQEEGTFTGWINLYLSLSALHANHWNTLKRQIKPTKRGVRIK